MACLAFSVHQAAGCSVAAAGGSGGGCRDRSLSLLVEGGGAFAAIVCMP